MNCPVCDQPSARNALAIVDEPCARCWCEAPEDCEQWEQAMRRWWHGYEQRRMAARHRDPRGLFDDDDD